MQIPEEGDVARRRPPRNFRVKIRQVGKVEMGELGMFLNGRSRLTDGCRTGKLNKLYIIAS